MIDSETQGLAPLLHCFKTIMRFRYPRSTIINDRPLNDLSGAVDTQTRPPVFMEESQTKLAGVNVDSGLANTGYRTSAHKRCDIFDRNSE